MPDPEVVTRPKIVLVEGKDEKIFFDKLCVHIEKQADIQILDFGGITQFRKYLKSLKASSSYRSMNVNSLGVIRDAELDMGSAFQSVCDALKASGFAVPSHPSEMVDGDPNISVFILPDCQNQGMLETLCWQAVARSDDSAIPCVHQYLDCLKKSSALPKNADKARLHTFLASRKEPGLLVGEATGKSGYWNLDSSVFKPLKKFLQTL